MIKRIALIASIAATFAVTTPPPVAAYQIVNENGPHGDVFLDDTTEMPAGTCNYGDVVFSNWAYLESMKVRAPQVFAADRNSDKRDRRDVSWQWKLQRKRPEAINWKVIKSSQIQRGVAYEDQAAPFTQMTLNYNSEKEDPDHNDFEGMHFRAFVIVKWYRNDGSVESWVKLVPSLYKINTYWDEPPNDDVCARVDTDG